MRLVVAGVPELVRRARRDGHTLARACDVLTEGRAKGHRPAEHLEALFLGGVDVRRRDEAVRLDEALDDDGLAARVGGRLVEDDALAGDRILDGVSCSNHCDLLFVR